MNVTGKEQRNCAQSVPDTCRDLIALRLKHGADTAIGHRCSNIEVMLRKDAPLDAIARQVVDLERLLVSLPNTRLGP